MMNIEDHGMSYNLVSMWLQEIGFDILDVTFAISKFHKLKGPCQFKKHRLTREHCMKWFDVIDEQADLLMTTSYPSIKSEHLEMWRERMLFKCLEIFNWVRWKDYERMFIDSDDYQMESLAPEIFKGTYGNWLHQGVLRQYITEFVDHSGTIPFVFQTKEYMKHGTLVSRITHLQVTGSRDYNWIQNLEAVVNSDEGIPSEILTANFVDWTTRPPWWKDWMLRACENIWGRECPLTTTKGFTGMKHAGMR